MFKYSPLVSPSDQYPCYKMIHVTFSGSFALAFFTLPSEWKCFPWKNFLCGTKTWYSKEANPDCTLDVPTLLYGICVWSIVWASRKMSGRVLSWWKITYNQRRPRSFLLMAMHSSVHSHQHLLSNGRCKCHNSAINIRITPTFCY